MDIVITFAFLGVYLVRIFGGVIEPPASIPVNILALMGISVSVPVISGGVSRIKYDTTSAVKELPPQLPPLSTMLENSKPALTRFQMFGWTWIGIIIYLAILFSWVAIEPLTSLTLPDIDPTLVILMGLSQGGYSGGKIVSISPMNIQRVVASKKDNTLILSIFGDNFGQNKDTVWFDDLQARGDSISSSNDSRIDVSIVGITLSEDSKYKIRVAKDSLIDEKEYIFKDKQFIEV
jgi:hypothetical protein